MEIGIKSEYRNCSSTQTLRAIALHQAMAAAALPFRVRNKVNPQRLGVHGSRSELSQVVNVREIRVRY